MIVLDIETSGGYPAEYGVWQIGAIEYENPENYFMEGARIDAEDKTAEEALQITGKTEEELRDKNKQSQKQLIINFLEWMKSAKEKTLLCHNPQFDINFLRYKSLKYFKKDPFWPNYHRALDLHTIAQMKFFEIHGKFLIKEDYSDMGLRNILKLCGIEDPRRGHSTEGTPHNALEDCKLEGECFSRLIYGKNLFPEYAKFKIPEVLKK